LQISISYQRLHSLKINILLDKTLIFGSDTGVNLDGDVMLNCGEVRHNWLDVSFYTAIMLLFAFGVVHSDLLCFVPNKHSNREIIPKLNFPLLKCLLGA